jgi:hypothetical protein
VISAYHVFAIENRRCLCPSGHAPKQSLIIVGLERKKSLIVGFAVGRFHRRFTYVLAFGRAAVLFTSAAPQPRYEAGRDDASSSSLTACIKIEHLNHHTRKNIPPDCGMTAFGGSCKKLVSKFILYSCSKLAKFYWLYIF